jgi:hypothetical protein
VMKAKLNKMIQLRIITKNKLILIKILQDTRV